MADEPRRVRTQAERDADGTTWRATADTRPGYCTYPTTPPGNPSWWQHPVPYTGQQLADGLADIAPYGPPPVDGETCTKWCGFCHLGTGEPGPPGPCRHTMTAPFSGQLLTCTQPADHPGWHRADDGTQWTPTGTYDVQVTERPPADPDIWVTTEPIAPPRRRWWHRYTRRNP